MSQELPGTSLTGHHHITMATLDPQEDFDFHTKVLGLKCIKRTLFYDGALPIYHLYYGNNDGEEGTLLTAFPVAHVGVKGRPGSGQVSDVSLSVSPDAIPYWRRRLESLGFEITETERFGETHLEFESPQGIKLSIAGVEDDREVRDANGPVPTDVMIRGTHSSGVCTRDMEWMEEFLEVAWGSRKVDTDGNVVRFAMGKGGSGTYTDFWIEPDRKPGNWSLGAGTIHHMAYNVPSREHQDQIKFFIEGLGYTDVSDVKDRGYFDSIYVRTPSGALFEACCSHAPAFTCDEEVFKVIGEIQDQITNA